MVVLIFHDRAAAAANNSQMGINKCTVTSIGMLMYAQ